MRAGGLLRHVARRLSPLLRQRGRLLRSFSSTVGLVYFGVVSQHEDDYIPIKGFTASLSHKDNHYAVGTYNGYNLRLVDRYDSVLLPGGRHHDQLWTIIEIELENHSLPHMFFVPTGQNGAEYSRLFSTQPTMQPLNTTLATNHSPEFHGRFQIMASATHSHIVETTFSSPIIVAIASRFWPHGIEIERGKLLVYITEPHLTKTMLEAALGSALWLAETIDEASE